MSDPRPALGCRLFVACLPLAVVAASCAAPTAPPPRRQLRMLVYEQANDGIPEQLGDAVRRSLPDVDVEVRRADSSVRGVERVQRGEADVAIADTDSVYLASVGQLEGQQAPFDHIRGIAVLQPRLIHLMVGKQSDINSVEALRGHRVAMSGGARWVIPLVLGAYGLGDHDLQLVTLPVSDKLRQLIDGRLEAAFFYGGYPLDEVKAAAHAGARLLPLSGRPVDKLRRAYPFLRPFETSPAQYGDGAVKTLGVNLVLICRNDLDEPIVHAVTKTLFEVLPALATLESSFRYVDVEQAAATPIALHAGAARFYRERELAR